MTALYALIACTVAVTYFAMTAPLGWEDRNGYHAGEPTEADLLSDYDNEGF